MTTPRTPQKPFTSDAMWRALCSSRKLNLAMMSGNTSFAVNEEEIYEE